MAVDARRVSLFVRDICATFFNVSDRLGWASLCAEQMNYGSISTIRAFRDWKGRNSQDRLRRYVMSFAYIIYSC